MAGRAANLARELTTIKSELRFMQERCGLLEEENKRLRDGYDSGGAAPEEDDLVITNHRPHFFRTKNWSRMCSSNPHFICCCLADHLKLI